MLLQTLLLETISEDTDSILIAYIEKVLPAMETEFALLSALGGSADIHYYNLNSIANSQSEKNLKSALAFANKADQSLLVHVLNALLTIFNLIPYLPEPLSDTEKYLFCLAITLHDYDKYYLGHREESATAENVKEIIINCELLGEKLNFDEFWADWREYISEIAYLAQNTQENRGSDRVTSLYPPFKIEYDDRLDSPLCHLLSFADIAVHLKDATDIVTETGGDRLREHLDYLDIEKTLVYHRLRDTVGILTNAIHNSTLLFAQELDWQPLLFFAQGVIYLAPTEAETLEKSELFGFIWKEVSGKLGGSMLKGEIGFKRDGKGLKVAPQTLELFTPARLIRNLPDVVENKVANEKVPATPKRLEKLALTDEKRAFLAKGADLRADRIAELIILAQREFLADSSEFIDWTLKFWQLNKDVAVEETKQQSGGVNYGWYQVASHYIASHPTLNLEEVTEKLTKYSNELVDWAEENKLLPSHHSPTIEIFQSYLEQYLEIYSWQNTSPSFAQEFATYQQAKVKGTSQPICSLSSGEFASEDQMDSVVLFKPQQYSNKNPLGGGQIKRGISKIWALEMLLRQALWAVPSGKLEEQQPIFLYIFPAYVYSPQTASAIRKLVNEIKSPFNLWEITKHWRQEGMNVNTLRTFSWLTDEADLGRLKPRYSKEDYPFMAINHTTTRGKTLTDAWVKPALIALALPILLGVKVVTTSSNVPLYHSDKDFLDSVILDAPAGFWQMLELPTSLRIHDLESALERLMTVYSIHIENRSNPPDARWQAFSGTARQVMTDVLNVFAIANEKLRSEKREASVKEVQRYWQYAEILAGKNKPDFLLTEREKFMQEKLKFTKKLVAQYRSFYDVRISESSHSILLPLSKALDIILSTPDDLDSEDLFFQGAGQLQDAIDRQEVYKRPLIKDKNIEYETRVKNELEAIQTFMKTCVEEVFLGVYKGDRALLQENKNRIKSGAEFAYKQLQISEKMEEKNLT